MFVVVYLHFGTAYQSHLQQHSNPETSVRDYQRTLPNIAEDLKHQLHCSGSLESRGKIYALIRSQMKEIIQHIKNIYIRQDSSVSILTTLVDGRSKVSCFDAWRRQEDLFSLLQNTRKDVVAQPASYLMGTGRLPRDKPDWA